MSDNFFNENIINRIGKLEDDFKSADRRTTLLETIASSQKEDLVEIKASVNKILEHVNSITSVRQRQDALDNMIMEI